MYKVQEAAKIAGVSVRTLHHYDHIDLLKPSDVGENRYRYYSEEDLKFLQHILFFKELGFPLKKIQEIMGGNFDQEYALTQHAELLQLKKQRIEKLLENIDRTQKELQGEITLTNSERFAAFNAGTRAVTPERYIKPELPDSTDNPEPTVETQEDIGETADRIYRSIASRMTLSPDHPEIQKYVENYFVLLNRSFDCSPSAFRRLGDLYVNDNRYTAAINQHGNGLADYLREAMLIYAGSLAYA